MRVRTVTKLCCLALPLTLSALPGCGGSSSESKVGDGAGAGGTTSVPAGHGGLPNLMLPPTAGSSPIMPGNSGGGGGANSGGVYMLPPGFTMTQKGGYKLGPAIDVPSGAAGAAGAGNGAAGTGGDGSNCGTQILGVVRDFKGANEPDGHPDFETFSGSSASVGIVKATLGSDQKPVYAGMGPFLDPDNGQQTTSKENFDQWYRATPNVNKPYLVYLYFEPNEGVLTFQSDAFFPLDGAGWGNTCTEADAVCKRQKHNFGFTTEVHTQFAYQGKETFKFTGDDDLWVFINHKLAIDLGGLHSKLPLSISLDANAKDLGIAVGGTYDLDLFHAERHTDASNFRVDTNLTFTNCGTVVDEPPVK